MGVFGAMLITVVTGQFSLRLMRDSLLATIRVSAMILMLIAASSFLSAAIAYMQLPTQITEGISALQLSPYGVLLMLAVLYIVLGMFLDWIGIALLTLPIFVPIVVQLGYDPIWFGILFAVNMQVSYLTPPFGPAAFFDVVPCVPRQKAHL